MPIKRAAVVLLTVSLLAAAGTGRAAAGGGAVNVFYAGSLVDLNEKLVGPAFSTATGYTYQGKGAGSVAIANQIKSKIATPDVIELADPTVNDQLMGSANGSYVSWYLTFARSELVVGFDPRSRFAAKFRAVQRHSLAWYQALEQPGLRLGRTDPKLDPKGYRALFMAGLAQRVFHLKGFKTRVFQSDDNPAQIFPEEVLVARMLTGQLDAGIFYLSEVRNLGIPYIDLPPQVNLGDPRFAKLYATQQFALNGTTIRGAPILYTISIPSTVRNQAGAEAFVAFVLGKRVRTIVRSQGLLSTKITLHGSRNDVPANLVHFIGMS